MASFSRSSWVRVRWRRRPTQALASKASDTAVAGRSGRRTGPAAWTPTSSDSARWWWLSVRDRDLGTPPASPVDRHRYVIPAAATGVWSGRAGQIAVRIVSHGSFTCPRWTGCVSSRIRRCSRSTRRPAGVLGWRSEPRGRINLLSKPVARRVTGFWRTKRWKNRKSSGASW